MSFLGLTGKTYLVLGVANKKSVAWHVAKTLESEGAKVVYSVRSQARLDSLKGLLDGKPVYLCDLEHEAQTQQLAAALFKAQAVDREWFIRLMRPPQEATLLHALRQRIQAEQKQAAARAAAGQPPHPQPSHHAKPRAV